MQIQRPYIINLILSFFYESLYNQSREQLFNKKSWVDLFKLTKIYENWIFMKTIGTVVKSKLK